jgi:hypothetical protein
MKPRDPRPLTRWTDERPVHLDADDYDGRAPVWAAGFGCHQLKLGCGARLILDETDKSGRVVTVLPKAGRGL